MCTRCLELGYAYSAHRAGPAPSSIDLSPDHPAALERRIAAPWGLPGIGMGWLCGVCRHIERTDGPYVAAPIPAVEAARRHNTHRHPRRLARAQAEDWKNRA